MFKKLLIIIFIITAAWSFWYDGQKGSFDYNYEGADQVGYYYPTEVREGFIGFCIEGMEEANNITERQKQAFCDCGLDVVENMYSFKEFDQKFGATPAMLKFFAKTIPPDIASVMKEKCVKKIKKSSG